MLKELTVSAFLLCVYSAHAFAAGDDSHHGETHHDAKGGLPQLDTSTYPSQIFWLVVIFLIMYFFFAKKSLPEISNTIEKRSERISSDLDSAEQLKEEVASVQKSYEESLTGAREKSSALFSGIEKEIKEKSDAYARDFQERSTKQVQELEHSIEEARKQAMDDMSDVAADLATQAAEKIIGVKADAKSAKAVVESINKAA